VSCNCKNEIKETKKKTITPTYTNTDPLKTHTHKEKKEIIKKKLKKLEEVICPAVPSTEAALSHCTATASLCIRYVVDFSSLVTLDRRPPRFFRKDKDSGPKTPDVSIATGVWAGLRLAYFVFFLSFTKTYLIVYKYNITTVALQAANIIQIPLDSNPFKDI